jgi:uncharacterized protein (TIGR01777 family)
MQITISGASGFIGRRLLKHLMTANHSIHVLSRHAGTNLPAGVRLSVWNPDREEPPEESLNNADAIVHLAGEPVAQRWTADARQKIRDSRVQGTRRLVQALSTMSRRPAVLVCASAIGIYGSRGDEILTESSTPGTGFLPDVCREWESQADLAQALGMRVVKIRIGIVLSAHGGALAKMLPAFKAFAGGRMGSGREWMSWIHLDDLAALIRYAVENSLEGAVNGTAPSPVTNAEFTRILAKSLHRPALFPIPGFALKMIFGEMAEVLLGSQRVLPRAAQDSGFRFQYAQLEPALQDLLSPSSNRR